VTGYLLTVNADPAQGSVQLDPVGLVLDDLAGHAAQHQQLVGGDPGDDAEIPYARIPHLLRGHREQVRATIGDGAGCDRVALLAGEHLRQSAFARAVRSHDSVHFADADRQVQTLQDGTVVDADV